MEKSTNTLASDKFPLLELSDQLLLLVSLYLDNGSFLNFSSSCQRLQALEKSLQNYVWEARVSLQHGIGFMADSLTNNDPTGQQGYWKGLAKQLHHGHGNYVGFAMDAWTNDFVPYPMDLMISKSTSSSNHGDVHNTARWRTLRDSLTHVAVTELTRHQNTKAVTSMSFSEVNLLRGRDILIPNNYKGYFFGRCCIGVFPNGCFFLIRKPQLNFPTVRAHDYFRGEPIPGYVEGPTDTDFSLGNVRSMNEISLALPLSKKHWEGISAVEIVAFSGFQMNRRPDPHTFRLTLDILAPCSPLVGLPSEAAKKLDKMGLQGSEDSELSSSKILLEKGCQGRLSIKYTNTTQPSDPGTSVSIEQAFREFSMPCIVIPIQKSQDSVSCDLAVIPYLENDEAASNSQTLDPMPQFVKESVFYAWYFQGSDSDCMFGLLKDVSTRRTGSFCLQQRAVGQTEDVVQKMMDDVLSSSKRSATVGDPYTYLE